MDRRNFLKATAFSGAFASGSVTALGNQSDAGAVDEFTAGSAPNQQVAAGQPVVTGPANDSISILQPLAGHATGYLEYALENQEFKRVDAATAGLLPFEPHVLKFTLPRLPEGCQVRYRVTIQTVGWVKVGRFHHGKIVVGESKTGPVYTFKTLDTEATSTRFVVWNDTHENETTLRSLHAQTKEIAPDFVVWNGDQSNDIHDARDMAGQFLAPFGLDIASSWPLAYVRGNHDVRGPAARSLTEFTGTPLDRFYYAFRQGPVAALVMDTGEDKPDDHPNFGGLAAFDQLRKQQAAWLATIIREPWFHSAPFKILFCHLPLWWVRDRKDIDWWEFSKVSRDAWLPSLVKGGINLVLSGHTHEAQWMPATETQPIAQLTGGGPSPNSATLTQVSADSQQMRIKMSRLDGTIVHERTFAANS